MSAPRLEPMPFVQSVPRSALAAYDLGAFWDEVFEAPGVPRPHYESLSRRLATLSPEEVEGRRRAADLAFRVGGITFAVNQGAEGVEKIMPFDRSSPPSPSPSRRSRRSVRATSCWGCRTPR